MPIRKRIPYSEAEMKWLFENYTMIISDYHAAFVKKFDRTDVKADHLHSLRKRKGWKVGRAKGRFVGRHLLYSEAEIKWLRDNVTMETDTWHAAFVKKFKRQEVTVQQLITLRKNNGWRTGRTGQYPKGHTPDNKGKKMPFNANSARTQFKKGETPANRVPLYSERVCPKEGYILIKVPKLNPWNGQPTMFMHKHKWLWEQENGPVPNDQALKCLDGDRTNTDPSNWQAVDRSMLPRLNNRYGREYDSAPAELQPTIMAIAKLEDRAAKLSRENHNEEDFI